MHLVAWERMPGALIAYWNAFIVIDITFIITEAVLTIDNNKNYADECRLCNSANYTGMTTCGLEPMIRSLIFYLWPMDC